MLSIIIMGDLLPWKVEALKFFESKFIQPTKWTIADIIEMLLVFILIRKSLSLIVY